MADRRIHNPTPHQPQARQAAIGHGRSGARHLVSVLAAAASFVFVLIACSGPGNQNEPPAAPGSVTANPIPGGVRIVWLDQSSNEAEFIVFRSTGGGEEDAATLTEIARVTTDTVMYEDFAVETSGSYQYAVAATNQFGTSEQVLQEPADAVSPGVGVRLTLTFAGVGSVDVLNSGQTVVCTSQCVLGIAQGSSVTLTAAGVEGSAFAGWDGACSMAGPCTFTINDDTDVEARFTRHVLLLSATGDSPVDLVVSPVDAFGATECTLSPGEACAFGYEFDAALKVSVNSTLVEAQATFGGYGGACTSPVGRYCLIDVDGETTVDVEVVRVPVVGAKAYAGLEDSPLTVAADDGLLAGVVDTPGDSHVAFVVSDPTSGSVTVADDGSFVYQPAQDANGEVTFQFAARDAHGNESAARTVTLTVDAVNDAPTFALAADPPATVGNAVPVSRPNFATELHPGGGADETGQTLTFTIVRTAGAADLLSAAPALTVSGTSATLTYTPGLGKFGTATYEARLKDTGGTTNGGTDTSAPLAFTLTVSPVTLTTAITGGSGGGSIGRNPSGTPNGPNRFA
ncbi:MAG TPA: Ig-like domain-containing protein, partial [Trueperaceae bacterium]|nr:Ig-like domain-containing protein [Trueperaceae bacterium]